LKVHHQREASRVAFGATLVKRALHRIPESPGGKSGVVPANNQRFFTKAWQFRFWNTFGGAFSGKDSSF